MRDQESYRGIPANGIPIIATPRRTFEAGRRCDVCDVAISRYNPNGTCYAHCDVMAAFDHALRTGRDLEERVRVSPMVARLDRGPIPSRVGGSRFRIDGETAGG